MSPAPDYKPQTAAERSLWKVMTNHRSFSHDDLRQLADVSDWARTNFIKKLRRLGHLHDAGHREGVKVMTVLDTKAAHAFTAAKRETRAGRIWTAIRSLDVFSTDDLEAILLVDDLGITASEIKKYCAMLVRAEYLKLLERARAGANPAKYRLINNSGPLPPIEGSRVCIIDQNEERVVRVSGVRV